jgi:putative endonuclease
VPPLPSEAFSFFPPVPPVPKVGAWGEAEAARFLERKGYRILARNWRNPRNRTQELDLVALQGDMVVIVEVKTRAPSLVPGYHMAVAYRKKRALTRSASAFLHAMRPAPRAWRFDVVEVTTDPSRKPACILHFENIPLLGLHFRP